MGHRGPPPTPTNVLKLRGSWRGNRNPAEPVPEPGRPRCPAWLDPDAKAAWRRLIPRLDRMGVLSKVDGNALARYCQLWARWRKAEEFIRDRGDSYVVKDESGRVKGIRPYPQVRMANQLAEQLLRLETHFGLTPSARKVAPEALRGRPCWGGLDLASTRDLTAFVLFFPEDGNAVLPFFWLPRESAVQRERRDRVPYTTWAREGHIQFTEGDVCDYGAVRRTVAMLADVYKIEEIAFDRWGAQQLVTNLRDDGHEVVAFGQGYASLSAPSKELEKLVVAGDLRHGGHPVLRWCASNVMVETDAAGNVKPSKNKSRERIDGIVALVMAIGRAIVREQAPALPYTAERGLIQL